MECYKNVYYLMGMNEIVEDGSATVRNNDKLY
jgi:hypothetical protein